MTHMIAIKYRTLLALLAPQGDKGHSIKCHQADLDFPLILNFRLPDSHR